MEHIENSENKSVEATEQQADERLTVEVPTEIQAGIVNPDPPKSRGWVAL